MRAMRPRYAAIWLLTYVQSIGMVLTASTSSRSSSDTSGSDSASSTGPTPCRSAGSGESVSFNDLPSLVTRSQVVFVGNVTKVRKVSVTDDLNRYRVRFAIVETVKGQSLLSPPTLQASSVPPLPPSNVDVIVWLPRVQRQTGKSVSLCIPVVGSRYVVFAAPAELSTSSLLTSKSSSSSKSPLSSPLPRRTRVSTSGLLTLEASGLPEPFTERALQTAKEFSCPKCGEFSHLENREGIDGKTGSQKLSLLGFNHVRPPRVSLTSGDVTLITDQRLRLQCRASGQPRPLITWYKDEQPIVADGRIRVTTNSRGSQLRISKVKVEDTGLYSCRGVNVLGRSKSVTASVVVRTIDSSSKPHSMLCENQSYCMNGGTCYVMTALDQRLCECKANFEGRRCEEKRVGQPVLATEKSSSLLSILMRLHQAADRID